MLNRCYPFNLRHPTPPPVAFPLNLTFSPGEKELTNPVGKRNVSVLYGSGVFRAGEPFVVED